MEATTKTALINLDIINEITHRDGKLAGYVDRIETEQIVENINIISNWARAHKHLAVHVKVGFLIPS